jgi:hypothetical protein
MDCKDAKRDEMVDVNWLHIGGAAGNIPALQHAM